MQAVSDIDAGTVFIRDFFHHRQPQSGAARFAGDIGLERPLQDAGRKAASAVKHAQAHAPRTDAEIGPQDHRFQGQQGLRLLGILGVLQQVVDDLAQLLRIPQHRRAGCIQIQGDRRLSRLVQMQDLLHQRIQIQGLQFRRWQASEVAEFIDQPFHGIHLVHNGFDRLAQHLLLGLGQLSIQAALQPFGR